MLRFRVKSKLPLPLRVPEAEQIVRNFTSGKPFSSSSWRKCPQVPCSVWNQWTIHKGHRLELLSLHGMIKWLTINRIDVSCTDHSTCLFIRISHRKPSSIICSATQGTPIHILIITGGEMTRWKAKIRYSGKLLCISRGWRVRGVTRWGRQVGQVQHLNVYYLVKSENIQYLHQFLAGRKEPGGVVRKPCALCYQLPLWKLWSRSRLISASAIVNKTWIHPQKHQQPKTSNHSQKLNLIYDASPPPTDKGGEGRKIEFRALRNLCTELQRTSPQRCCGMT